MDKFKYKDFAKWAKKEGLRDDSLLRALAEMDEGLVGSSLGSNVYKKRVALPGRGKRGGARTILFFKKDDIAVFIYGYSKNDKDDLEPNEEEGLREFAKGLLKLSDAERSKSEEDGVLIPIKGESK